MSKHAVFLGPPGSGKGSLGKKVESSLKFQIIATGDIFKYNIKNKTPLGVKVKSIIDTGGLVEDDLTNALVADALKKIDLSEGIIFDGYPRTIPQAEALAKMMPIDMAINFCVSEEIVIKRICGRMICRECGAIYNKDNVRPKLDGVCDIDGGQLYVRDDDKPETVHNRLIEYNEKTAPLINYYWNQNKLHDIDAGQPGEKVYESFVKIIGVWRQEQR